jgi:hypothetical protein
VEEFMRALSGSGRFARRRLAVVVGTTLVAVAGMLAAPSSAQAIGDPSPPQCFVTATPNPSPLGSPVSFRFFVSTGTDTPPGPFGVVTFFDGASLLEVDALIPDGLTVDHSSVTATTSDLSQGTHTIRAVLDPPLLPQCNGILGVTVTQTVSAPASSTSLTSSVNPSVYGQATTFTASVTRSDGGTPAGSVQFQADGTDLGAPQTLDGSGHAAMTTAALPAGLHNITAHFTSSGGESDSDGTLFLDVVPGQLVEPAATTTSVTSSPNPSVEGDPVTLAASVGVVPPGGGTPSGSVQFSSDGTALGGSQPMDGSGHASTTTSALSPGSHTITATYLPGDGNFASSSGSTSQFVKAATVLTYTGATTSDYHDTATLSARLTRSDDGAPLAGRPVAFTMAGESCSGTTDANGVAPCAVVPQEPAGTYSVGATYAGDGTYAPSAVSRPFVVTREETTATYTGPTVVLDGGTLHASGRLLEDGVTPVPGRTLTFTLGSGSSPQTCTGFTDASGNAACDITAVDQPLGPGTVTASFAQDPYYLASADTRSTIVFAFPNGGAFVVGDRSATPGATVTYSDSQWSKVNSLSGGSAPSSFKGFATDPGNPPACGGTFTADPGNSGHPPSAVPSYMGVLVTSSVTKSGSTISGARSGIVVVRTTGSPSGRGVVVASFCP